MGVFVFSNKTLQKEKIEEVFISRGHKSCNEVKQETYDLVYSNKILKQNENFVSFDGGFILGIGTFFYKQSRGVDALKELYDDFDINTFKFAHDIYGHYAFVINKNGTTYIFNDRSGTFILYYYIDNNRIVVSSSMLSLISQIDKPCFNKSVLSHFISGGLYNAVPFIQGIERLDSEEAVIFENSGKFNFFRKPKAETPPVINNLDDAVSYCVKLFDEELTQIKSIGDEKVSLELTGGLDSRLLCSILERGGLNFDFAHYPLFGPDREIAEYVSKATEKKLNLIEHKGNGSNLSEDWAEFDFMFNYYRHYPTKRWKTPSNMQFSGLTGEYLTNMGLQEKTRKNVLTENEDLIFDNTSLFDNNLIREYFYSHVKKKFGIERNESLSCDQIFLLNQYIYTQYTDALFISAQNAHQFFYSLYNEWNFTHFVSNIALDVKDGRRLSIALIKHISRKFANYPCVSRRRTKIKSVDSISFLPSEYKSFNGIKALLPKCIVDFLYSKMGRKFSVERLNEIDINQWNNLLDISRLKKYPNLYYLYLNRLYSLEVIRKRYNINFE